VDEATRLLDDEGMLAAPLGGGLLRLLEGDAPRLSVFKQTYLIIGGLDSVSLFPVFLMGGRLPTRASPEPPTMMGVMRKFREDVWAVATDTQVLLTSSMEGVQNLTVGVLEAFLPVYVTGAASLTSFHAGVLWGVQLVVLMFTKPFMGRLSDRRGKPMITAGMIICLVAFILHPLTRDFALLCGLTLVFGLGESMMTSSTAAMVVEQTKARGFGTSMGVFGSLWDVGHASGPILTGLLLSRLNYVPAFGVISLILLAATALFQLFVKTSPKAA